MGHHLHVVSVLVTLLFICDITHAAPPVSKCCRCRTLDMETVLPNTSPQVLPSPFQIKVDKTAYRPDSSEEIKVSLTVVPSEAKMKTFRQFMLHAVNIDKKGNILNDLTSRGEFTPLDGYAPVQIVCDGRTVKSADNSEKSNITISWMPRGNAKGPIRFRATFVQDDDRYWVHEVSQPIAQIGGEALELGLSPQNAFPLIDPIHTDTCGTEKGCFRIPEGCWEPYCEYIATWKRVNQGVYMIEMGGYVEGVTDKYVSLALSEDTRWGGDRVFECVHHGSGVTEVFQARSVDSFTERFDKPQAGIQQRCPEMNLECGGQFYQQRIRCRFLVSDNNQISTLPLSGEYHLIMSRGAAADGMTAPHKYGHNEYPKASPVPVALTDTTISIGGYARYPMVKAHGILMILGWCFFGTIGLLLTKYYKPMWPNKRFYGQRYWFLGHFNCMAMVFLFIVIASILIFVETGGYSKANHLPYEAHPILGIIILCCVIINPIIALLRPPDDHTCRPCVNWIHWAFGTIAWCLAIPNMFIGMDFGKAHVPWWSTWILFIYILFHIIVEITLEVHQCCTHKKNKERRKKYEFQKRENPKAYIPEPEPAGRIFKRNMLIAHFIVTCIVALIMLIAIAAS